MSEELADRLLTAISEREDLASESESDGYGNWSADDLLNWGPRLDESPMHKCEREHIALHDPSSVLRRCAADRDIVTYYTQLRMNVASGKHEFVDQLRAVEWVVHQIAQGYSIKASDE